MKTVIILSFFILTGFFDSARKPYGLQCTPYDMNGIQHCMAGIESGILDVTANDRQHATEWCWAASIEAVFSYYGHTVSQEEIVKQMFGSVVNMPGQPNVILSALNRTWTDDNGNTFQVTANSISATPATAAQDLSTDNPLIIGTLGHAMVLTALEYNHDSYGRGNVTSAIVRDPWPYNPQKRILSPQEWFNTSFLARIRVY